MSRASRSYESLKGPIVPLNVCFNEDQTINFEATARYVDWLCAQKIPVVMLTFGSSELGWMTEQDIFDLTAAVGKAIRGRSHFVASTGCWPVRRTREFLKHAEASDADSVKVQISTWEGVSGSILRGYFDGIVGAAGVPLLLWYNPGPVPTLARDVLEAICELAKWPDIIGIKNDGHPFYDYYDMIRGTVGEQFAVISGGQMRNFTIGYPLGSPAYLCPIAPFRPDIALEFYHHLVEGRADAAREVVFRFEEPLMRFAGSVNWLFMMKTAIRMLGFYPTSTIGAPRRGEFSPDESARIEAFLKTTFSLGKGRRDD